MAFIYSKPRNPSGGTSGDASSIRGRPVSIGALTPYDILVYKNEAWRNTQDLDGRSF